MATFFNYEVKNAKVTAVKFRGLVYVNLTSTDVILQSDGEEITFPPSGFLARAVEEGVTPVSPFIDSKFGLPVEESKIKFIVDEAVFRAIYAFNSAFCYEPYGFQKAIESGELRRDVVAVPTVYQPITVNEEEHPHRARYFITM